MGATTISELEMERGIEDFEKQCWEKINITLRNNEVQEDQDDSVICDVCRSVSWQIEYHFLTLGLLLCKHFIRSTEFDENLSQWR